VATADASAVRHVPLPDGGRLTVRPVASSDADGVAALYGSLSHDDRYLRFFSDYSPPRSFYERLVSVVDRSGYGLVAVEGDTIVGEAGYELLANGDGELGMTVAADARGWLGPYLLDALVEAAAIRGVPNLEAQVLVVNRRMLALLRSRGYATVTSGDWCSLRLVVGTAGHTPVWPAGADATGRPRVLVEAPGGRWHAGAEAESAGLQVMACSGPRGPRPRCPVLEGRSCPLAAGADVIVMSHAPDDPRWHAVAGAHADLHPGVPVCIEPRPGPQARTPSAREVPDRTAGALVVDRADDPRVVVGLVERLAAGHGARGTDRPRPPGGTSHPTEAPGH
jgi:hypothetical protein